MAVISRAFLLSPFLPPAGDRRFIDIKNMNASRFCYIFALIRSKRFLSRSNTDRSSG
ncbi:hypothetical protein P175DRAFT_0501811 [Aspergillus ochraceoroseus IBT 24754]|uniref:Uncharacterized protein n=1 Tax=Aspergillus ochraceoroseus IBT 24754 TaxID=1392256 RepID=A0A2T5LXZ7_9EURO|nr:uncharacterized protein P175DRAFT_0501811 [Aspergillus ochraceoroseus IBT 24754]PTU21166.1 hypothetical protein P175DRAFT_0501811 [Aspergillus ochraceoroseus IBT 24754]